MAKRKMVFFGIGLYGQPHFHVTHTISCDSVNIGKVLTQSSLGHLPENLNSSPSNPDIVDLIKEVKEVKEGVKRIGNNLANCVEKMSFVMSTMEGMSRRLDRIEARLGIQDTHPQRVAGVRRSDMAIGYVVNFNGNYYLQSMFHPPAPLFNPVSGDQVMMDAEDQFDNPRNP